TIWSPSRTQDAGHDVVRPGPAVQRAPLTQVTHNDRSWRAWFDKPAPEDALVPDGYNTMLDTFRKLLLIRSWCPNRTIAQTRTSPFGSNLEGNYKKPL
uniref:Uncharacterized protein n=1 Tax=Hucho hucho TaxID=62062 RepID=A0A4W5MM58_9TELE